MWDLLVKSKFSRKLLLAVLSLELTSVGLLYILNGVRGDLYSGIQNYQPHLIWISIAKFCVLAGLLVLTSSYSGVYLNLLGFSIREGLTKYVTYYQTNPPIFGRLIVPEPAGQRIQEDLRKFGELTTQLGLALLQAGLKIPIFLLVVVHLTKWYTGLLILASVVGGTYLTKRVGSKLVPLQVSQESNEAEFRLAPNMLKFRVIRENFLKLNSKLKLLLLTQSSLDQIFALLPFILLMPLYISKQIVLGSFFQTVDALRHVIDSLIVIIDNRQVLVNIQAVRFRLQFLEGELEYE